MRSILRWSAVAAAVISVAAALSDVVRGVDYPLREPKTAVALAPLQRAPMPEGADVLLVLPRQLAREEALAVLFEAAWQRPDVHWSLPDAWPPGLRPDALVTVGSAAVPPGWRRLWSDGLVAVWGRSSQ